jgi:hypothetical protein
VVPRLELAPVLALVLAPASVLALVLAPELALASPVLVHRRWLKVAPRLTPILGKHRPVSLIVFSLSINPP